MRIERHYSISTLAEKFDTSKDFWRKRIASGEVKAIKLGRAVRVPEKEVLKVVRSMKTVNLLVEEIIDSLNG